MSKIKETYKGFDIVCKVYDEPKYFFSIFKDGKEVVNTLWNDDKHWRVGNVMDAAKTEIDDFLSGKDNTYFKLFKYNG